MNNARRDRLQQSIIENKLNTQMNTVLSTERIAIKALENASREHTVQAVNLLAKVYGFDAAEALEKVGLRHDSDTVAPAAPDTEQEPVTASKPSRDDVVARLLRGEDPVPVLSSDEDTSSDTKRAPKPRLTATQKEAAKLKKAQAKQKRELAKKAKEAEKLAGKMLKAALKALKAFDKDADKAVKEATKVHKALLKTAKQDAAKTTKAALKAVKSFEKAAAKAAKAKAKPAKRSPKAKTTTEKIPVVDAEDELEEEELEVRKVVVEGATYYRDESGEMFDFESHDPVGRWCEQTQSIVRE